MTTKEELRDRLFGSLIGFQTIWVANIGLTAGLFQAIADSSDGITEAVLSARLGYEPRYVRVWCRAAYAFEWVEYDEATGYDMTSEMRALLLISELPYPGTIQEYRTAPAYRMLAGVQHHEMLVGCGMITIPELQRLLTDAGYRNVRRCRQPSPTRIMYLAER